MRNAAMLAENDANMLMIFDTGGTAEGAAAAAKGALKRNVAMILGPLLAVEVSPVADAVGSVVPVIAFSNDAVLRRPGTFIFGITPSQVTTAVLRYARTRGVRRVAVIDDQSPWSSAAALAAAKAQDDLGMDVRVIALREGQPLPAAGDAPDAVLVPGSGDSMLAAARNLKQTGIQLLGTLQALDHRPSALEVLDGAWLASPDPRTFAEFASAFEARNGGDPGAIAALAYDAAGIAKSLRDGAKLGRDGLLAPDGFACVTGQVHFRTDGSVTRDLAILVAGSDGYQPVAVSRGA